ncbi:MAG TPA: RNase H family protein [Pirellulales bacterium]|jgi:ribonuclease HI|nr:RNase H family protein [Pirellulales bacterium]
MSLSKPHFVLLADARRRNDQGEWSFVLKAADGSALLEASESSVAERGERLELLSVVRGLEALDQPSQVTLVTASRYVRRGIAHGLEEWRRNDWTWESFGEMIPVKNRDLWQRLGRAMDFHRIDVRTWRLDPSHHGSSLPATPPAESREDAKPAPGSRGVDIPVCPPSPASRQAGMPAPSGTKAKQPMPAPARPTRIRSPGRRRRATQGRARRWCSEKVERWKTRLAQLGTDWFPKPWLD